MPRRLLAVLTVLTVATVAFWRVAAVRPHPPAPDASHPTDRAEPVREESPMGTVRKAPEEVTTPASTTAIVAFERWLVQNGAALARLDVAATNEGRTLARQRRSELKALMAANPKEALQHIITGSIRGELPASIQSELESIVDAYGEFELISICEPQTARFDRWTTIGSARYATYTYGRRLETISKRRIPIHGAAIDDVLALSDQPYRPVATSGQGPVRVQVGDSMKTFDSEVALAAWTEQETASEQQVDGSQAESAPATAAAGSWTTGEKSVLWIRVEFPDDAGSPATDDQILAGMAQANTLYQDVSHGTCSLKPTILPGTVKLASVKATYTTTSSSYINIRTEALQLARTYDIANGATGKYNPDNYDRYIVVCKRVTEFTWAGMGAVGNRGVSLNGTVSGSVAAHELGHNQGLRHSHAWAPSSGDPIGAGAHMEYGDAFDDMGAGQYGDFGGHFNVVQKANLGYLTADNFQTITQSGTYRIYRHDDRAASGIQGLKITSPWPGVNYVLEYRHAAPFPIFATPYIGQPQLARLQNGVVVHLDKAPTFATGPGTYLLDMTPTSSGGVPAPADMGGISRYMDDAALALGESFSDSAINLTITPVTVGGSAPGEWIDVYVSLGATTGNRAPSLTATAPASPSPARTDLTFSATASDADGDTVYYHWDFGDGTVAQATGTVTHRWLKGGTYSVLCTALDGRGGRTSTTIQVSIEDPLLSWQRRGIGLTNYTLRDVIFDGSKFVLVGSYTSATSTDGVNWTMGRGFTTRSYNYAIAYGGGRYVTVGGLNTTSACVATSTDGASWTEQPAPAVTARLVSIAYGAGKFIAVGAGGTLVASTDGVTWTTAKLGITADLFIVRFANGRFVVAGSAGTYLTSTDGVVWQDISIPGESSSAFALAYFNGAWISVTGSYATVDSTKRVGFRSTDAQSWTKMYFDVDFSVQGLIPIANATAALALSRTTDGRAFFTESLVDWSPTSVIAPSTLSGLDSLYAAAEGNGTIVVVGSFGMIYTPSGRPFVVSAPASQTVTVGGSVTLSATGYATGPFTYQWKKDGASISGATGSTFTIPSASTADAGKYTVTLTNATGSFTTTAATVTVNGVTEPPVDIGRLSNLSIRTGAGTGDQTLIVGVSVTAGTNTKPLLVRAVGPTLASFGVSGALADPVLTILKDTTTVASNDGWRDNAQIASAGAALGAFPLKAGSADAALYTQLGAAAGYTMKVAGKTGTGVALVEVYDASASFTTATPRLYNVSARTLVGTGDNVLIAGFAIAGSTNRRLLIRATGPALADFGVGGTLADPKVELFSDKTKLSENDNWAGTDISAAAASVGAFALKAGSKDAAMVIELKPGTYSVVVRGVGDTTGVALVELYELP